MSPPCRDGTITDSCSFLTRRRHLSPREAINPLRPPANESYRREYTGKEVVR